MTSNPVVQLANCLVTILEKRKDRASPARS